MSKTFASQGDLSEKEVRFVELAEGAWAYTAEGDPNSGVVIGDDGVMVIDAQATPVLARRVIERIHEITDKPIRCVVLTHYHAVRVLGASAYDAEQIVASRATRALIVERGKQDWDSELGRFPRLFQGAETIPGLTWPTLVFDEGITLWMGKRRVDIRHLGRGHTAGDVVVWLPEEKVLYSGDLVEYGATPYTGDAYLRDWPATLDRLAELGAEKLVPGRGDALQSPEQVAAGVEGTRSFVTQLYESVARGRAAGKSLEACYREARALLAPQFGDWVIFEHCLPFDVARAYDEAGDYPDPRIWTAERDREMWHALQNAMS